MKRAALLVAFLAVAAAGGVGFVVSQRVRAPFRGYEGHEQFVDIPAGSGSRSIGERLVAAGVVRDALTFRVALWMSGDGRRLKAGEYRFDQPVAPADVIAKIARGEVYTVSVTFPEGLTIAEMAATFEGSGLGTAGAFVDAAHHSALVAARDRQAPDLEGYLFPDTYLLSRHTDAPTMVRTMVDRFARAWTPEHQAAANAFGLTSRQFVTLASIVEKETAQATERPIVAAVYLNRLKIHMPLQCDPTVIFALARAGRYTGNLRRDDLHVDSPYNTYRYGGLPPGPIAAPGRASLDAAAHPAAVDYLYFVSRNDGSHAFARTLAEHNQNVQRYQVEYFRTKGTRGRQRGSSRPARVAVSDPPGPAAGKTARDW